MRLPEAGADGITLFIGSAFRSIGRQAGIVRRRLEAEIPSKKISLSVRRRALVNTTPAGLSTFELRTALCLKLISDKPRHMLGSIITPANSATICLIPLAIRGVISMSRGTGVSGNPGAQICTLRKPEPPGCAESSHACPNRHSNRSTGIQTHELICLP